MTKDDDIALTAVPRYTPVYINKQSKAILTKVKDEKGEFTYYLLDMMILGAKLYVQM
jgi:hypothetical protein